MEEVRSNKSNVKASSIAGILLIAIGSLIFLDNFGIVDIHWQYDIFNWQVVLIVVGLFMLCDKGSRTAGIVLIAIGTFFLLLRYVDFSGTIRKLFWPAVFIFFGLSLIVGKRNRKAHSDNNDDFIEDFALLGGNKQSSTSQNLIGGRVRSIFGSSTINLMESKLSENNENRIKVLCVCGSSKIIIPPCWHVKIEATTICGSITDKRGNTNYKSSNTPELIIKGVIIGGNCCIV